LRQEDSQIHKVLFHFGRNSDVAQPGASEATKNQRLFI